MRSAGSYVDLREQSAAPATPGAGFGRFYPKTDNKIYFKGDDGVEYDLTLPKGLAVPRGPTGWAIAGEITSTTAVAGISVPVPAGWTCFLTRGRHYIESGTSITWRLQNNGADITGWGTSVSPLSSSTTAATNDPADIAIADWDKLDIVWGTATGTPNTWSLILELLYTYVG